MIITANNSQDDEKGKEIFHKYQLFLVIEYHLDTIPYIEYPPTPCSVRLLPCIAELYLIFGGRNICTRFISQQ